jgi:alpha-L-fucosidase
MFLGIVSRGGNLLLIVNLDAQGALPEIQKARLEDIGKWLAVNGEAIYATRKYDTTSEGPVRYTRSKDESTVYAITTEWPGKTLELKSVVPLKGSEIRLLGDNESLKWTYDEAKGLTVIEIP